MIKNPSILISKHLCLSLTSLYKASEGVCYNISFFITIINLKVILRDILGSTNLSVCWTFCIYKFVKVISIKDKNLVSIVLHIEASTWESLNNGKSSEIYILYQIFVGIIWLKKKVIEFYFLDLEVNWLRTPPIT